jgi:hypothetical protein
MHDMPGSASGYTVLGTGGGQSLDIRNLKGVPVPVHLLHIDLFLFTFSFVAASKNFEDDPDLPNLVQCFLDKGSN